jgi:mono/diheme cytochrome c family protein
VRAIALSALLLASTAARAADESGVKLADGPGKDLVLASCAMCHSLDYIPMNSPFLDRKGWEASVNKMVKVMGAPVAADDVPKIVDYLAAQYGKKEPAATTGAR